MCMCVCVYTRKYIFIKLNYLHLNLVNNQNNNRRELLRFTQYIQCQIYYYKHSSNTCETIIHILENDGGF